MAMKTSRNAAVRLSAALTVAVLCVLASMVLLGNTSLLAADGSEAIHSLAKILLDFTHVPSASQKAALQHILDDKATTAAERVLAQALINVEHLASPEDKPKLEALIRDESVPPAVKTLATIVRNLTHTPTEMNKMKLRQLLQHVC
jgi:hypothetical protein